jgi:hypothetical protein
MSAPTDNGGPAFPVADTVYPSGQVQHGFNGMSLRDYFAAHALAGLLADGNASSRSVYAIDAYDIADSMIAARERKGGAA